MDAGNVAENMVSGGDTAECYTGELLTRLIKPKSSHQGEKYLFSFSLSLYLCKMMDDH